MRIIVKAKPGARQDMVEKTDDSHFTVSVTEPPVQGRANRAIIRVLAEYFGVPEFRISIRSGHTSRQKIIEVI